MFIHREGYSILAFLFLAFSILFYCLSVMPIISFANFMMLAFSAAIFYLLVLQFFRNPKPKTAINAKQVLAPAEGKVVVIEETIETEYFNDKRIQVSIFMSPFNVHVNRNPVSGVLKYFKYHPGKYLVAWNPKASTDNERTTLVVENEAGIPVLFRQIAGALARRIKWYIKEGDTVTQGEEFGFIKFGSRVDIFLPLGTTIKVKLDDITLGGETVIAEFK